MRQQPRQRLLARDGYNAVTHGAHLGSVLSHGSVRLALRRNCVLRTGTDTP